MATPTTLPSTFAASSVLTSTQMNDLRGAFRVLQVVSTTKTDTFSGTLTGPGGELEITNLNVAITPSATSSKILILAHISRSSNNGNLKIKRDSTDICIGDAAGSRSRVSVNAAAGATYLAASAPLVFLDSPNTTSATTYKVFFQSSNSNNVTVNVNRSGDDTDATSFGRYTSTITALEISA
jgi:hypothetical protein